jgi:ribosomal protein S18 acetylase RimI-like enzyme
MLVRRARLEDAPAIAEVHVRTWQAAYEHVFGAERLAGIDVSRRELLARRFIEGEQFDIFVAEDEGALVGFAATGPPDAEDETRRELYAIYVLPSSWGSDAGRKLLHMAVQAMRDRGEPAGILWVLTDNPRARRFYEREGWIEDGVGETEYLGVSAPLVRYRIQL